MFVCCFFKDPKQIFEDPLKKILAYNLAKFRGSLCLLVVSFSLQIRTILSLLHYYFVFCNNTMDGILNDDLIKGLVELKDIDTWDEECRKIG